MTSAGILAHNLANALNAHANSVVGQLVQNNVSQVPEAPGEISIKAFSFNYAKFKKTETEILGIMS